jgi:hypothetical protein
MRRHSAAGLRPGRCRACAPPSGRPPGILRRRLHDPEAMHGETMLCSNRGFVHHRKSTLGHSLPVVEPYLAGKSRQLL